MNFNVFECFIKRTEDVFLSNFQKNFENSSFLPYKTVFGSIFLR